jgi:hypothetical protein
MVWAFDWWPHAVWHGLNPFYSHLVYAPGGFDVAHGELVPGAALLLAPVTAIAGPLFAFNLAMLLSPVLAAFFAFLLCRRLTGAFWPSLLGGWLFGFSTYMLGQLTSHPALTLVFLVPAIVHLVVRALAGELRGWRLVALLAAALTLQFFFSAEVFVTFTMFAAVALVLAYALGDGTARARLRGVLGPVALAYALTAVLSAPYLYYALKPGGLPVLPWRTDKFSNDLLAFFVPTQITQAGGLRFLSTSREFTAGHVEGGAYLGLPLLALAALAAWRGRRRLEVQVMLGTLLVVAVLTLGGQLHVGGAKSVPLPWAAVHELPVLGLMTPSRFVVYAFLIAAVLAATLLAARGRHIGAWLLAALCVVSLWPAIGRDYWRSTADVPRLFATSAYRGEIRPSDTVLALPVGIAGQSMLWHGMAHLDFKLAGGYLVAPEAPNPYKDDPIYPTLTYGTPVPGQQRAAARFLADHHVTVAALDADAAASSPWVPMLQQLGWQAKTVAGAVLLRPRGIVAPPPQPVPPPASPRAAGPVGAQRAAQRTAAAYFRAFAAGDGRRACALLTRGAIAAQAQDRRAGRAQCAASLRHATTSALRRQARAARIGPATVRGEHAYVAVTIGSGPPAYLPLRLVAARWLVDGPAVP